MPLWRKRKKIPHIRWTNTEIFGARNYIVTALHQSLDLEKETKKHEKDLPHSPNSLNTYTSSSLRHRIIKLTFLFSGLREKQLLTVCAPKRSLVRHFGFWGTLLLMRWLGKSLSAITAGPIHFKARVLIGWRRFSFLWKKYHSRIIYLCFQSFLFEVRAPGLWIFHLFGSN
jgi:hypothetical protein